MKATFIRTFIVLSDQRDMKIILLGLVLLFLVHVTQQLGGRCCRPQRSCKPRCPRPCPRPRRQRCPRRREKFGIIANKTSKSTEKLRDDPGWFWGQPVYPGWGWGRPVYPWTSSYSASQNSLWYPTPTTSHGLDKWLFSKWLNYLCRAICPREGRTLG